MNKKILVKCNYLYPIIIFIFYTVLMVFNIRGGYLSGDEMGFLTSFSDRNAEDQFDLRYFFWTSYISNTANIHLSLPLVINLFFTCVLISKCIKYQLYKPSLALLIMFLPTIFYFFNGYLRDVFFFITSILLIVLIGKEYRIHPIKFMFIIFVWLLVLSMRPFYGTIYLVAFILSHQFFANFFRLILVSLFFIFVISAFLIYVNQEVYNQYFEFFYFGHLRGKDQVGTLMIPVENFTQTKAAMNFLFSPFFFWFIPFKGFGSTYDILLYLENGLIFIIFLFALITLSFRSLYNNRMFRMAWIILLLSLFMAAATTVHGDAYRFRLFFLPVLFYLASCVRFNPMSGKVSAFLRSHIYTNSGR